MKELLSTLQLSWPARRSRMWGENNFEKLILNALMWVEKLNLNAVIRVKPSWPPPFHIYKKVIPRVITGRTPSQFQIPTHCEHGGDREEETHCERQICSAESWPSCPPISVARLSGSRSMSDWLLTPLLIKADLIWAATDPDDRQHLLGAVPTGYGKSLPMLVAALLLPPGEPASCWQICLNDALLILTTTVDTFSTGSTTIIIPPLTVIERQLQEDCLKYGIEVLVGSQVCSEFRASSKPLHHLQLCVKLCHVYWWPPCTDVDRRIWVCYVWKQTSSPHMFRWISDEQEGRSRCISDSQWSSLTESLRSKMWFTPALLPLQGWGPLSASTKHK